MPLKNNPLDKVLESYYFTLDALSVTDRIVDESIANPSVATFLSRTQYAQSSRDAATVELLRCFDLWEDYVILALWAEFERALIRFISIRFPYAPPTNDTQVLRERMSKTHDKFLERAFIDDKINIFQKLVPVSLLSITHQIKEYRNWVAHQNQNKPRPQKVDAETAYLTLTDFLEEMEQYS